MSLSLDAEQSDTATHLALDSRWERFSRRPTAVDSHPISLDTGTKSKKPLFNSFWMAGFEAYDHINRHGQALTLNTLTQHGAQAAADYARLAPLQIHTVRESVGWRLSECDGRFDFSHLAPRARAAAANGVQVIWTLMHYGWPQELNILSEDFVRHFSRYAGAAARYLSRYSGEDPMYAPIHEISYLSWALCEGPMTPPGGALRGRGTEVKCQLVRAAIAACDAIRAVDPRARFLHADPLVHIVAPVDRPDLNEAAAAQREQQFEVWDMLCGRTQSGLGGAPRYLDIIGLDYFPGNQWELATGRALPWHTRDPRRAALADLLAAVHRRYDRPLLIAETGHTGVERGRWVRDVATEVRAARERGVAVEGVCLYSVLDRPDWNNTSQWLGSGLWSVEPGANGTARRVLNHGYASDLRLAQASLMDTSRIGTVVRQPGVSAKRSQTAQAPSAPRATAKPPAPLSARS